MQTGVGAVNVKVPKVRSKTGKPVSFRSALVPPYVRKAKSLEAALPWLYLKGISTGEMGATLKVLLGPDATGFSAKTISRLKGQWAAEYDTWRITVAKASNTLANGKEPNVGHSKPTLASPPAPAQCN